MLNKRNILLANSMAGGSIDTNNYLTIYALEDGLTASLSTNACEYCIDGDGNWKSLAAGTATESINTDHRLSFRGNLTPTSSAGIGRFTISKFCNLEGNCMSMLFGDNAANNLSLAGKDYAFYKLFYTCKNIVGVSENFLPATTLATWYCYRNMFSSCTNLTTAPTLPATIMTNECYASMFYYCTNLTTAPALPATTLAKSCYEYMFQGCSSLTTAPELPATTLTNLCYYQMFYSCSKLNYIKMLATDISASRCLSGWVSGVASTGTFVKNPVMASLPTGVDGIPEGWTVVNDGEDSGDSNSKTIYYIRMSYEESGPDEYSIDFEADFPPASDITLEMDGESARLDTTTTMAGLVMILGVPTLERLTYSPKEDDTYIYKVIMA